MTEQEWLACAEPGRMLDWIRLGNVAAEDDYPPNYAHCPVKVSENRLRCFVESCRDMARPDKEAPWAPLAVETHLTAALQFWSSHTTPLSKEQRAALLREVFGNPFRPVLLPWRCRDCNIPCGPPAAGYYCVQCGADEAYCPWRTPTVLSLAQAAQEKTQPQEVTCKGCGGGGRVRDTDVERWQLRSCYDCHGTGKVPNPHVGLDPDRFAVLGDALEDAGCTDESVLRHCRGYKRCVQCGEDGCTYCKDGWVEDWWLRTREPSPPLHVRGCWVLGLLLGRE